MSGKSQAKSVKATSKSSQLTLLLEDSPAPTSQLQASARAWLEKPAASGSSFIGFYESCVRAGALSKMSPVSFHLGAPQNLRLVKYVKGANGTWKRKAILKSSSVVFRNSGMASSGVCLTLNTSDWHSAANVSSLSDILETDVPLKYYLSPKACAGILQRAEKRGRALPPQLHSALATVASLAASDSPQKELPRSEPQPAEPIKSQPFKCPECGESFSDHHTGSTGLAPAECPRCGYEFMPSVSHAINTHQAHGDHDLQTYVVAPTLKAAHWNVDDGVALVPDEVAQTIKAHHARNNPDETMIVAPTLLSGANRTGGTRQPGTSVDTAESLVIEAQAFNWQQGVSENDRSYITRAGDYAGAVSTTRQDAVAYNITLCDANGTRSDRPNGGMYVNATESANTLTNGGTATHILRQGVRRLTPTECEMLQGLPRGWTDGQSDSVRYREIGNGGGVPILKWLGERINASEEKYEQELAGQVSLPSAV